MGKSKLQVIFNEIDELFLQLKQNVITDCRSIYLVSMSIQFDKAKYVNPMMNQLSNLV